MTDFIFKFRSQILFTVIAGMLASTPLSLTGCYFGDGALSIRGIVYEWVNPPAGATSKIYVTNVTSWQDVEPTLEKESENFRANGIPKLPLENVEISAGDKFKTTSDLKGEFSESWVAAPGRYTIHIKASKSGYLEVSDRVAHGDAFHHVVIVLLVRKPPAN